jgi:hypothetical protein
MIKKDHIFMGNILHDEGDPLEIDLLDDKEISK